MSKAKRRHLSSCILPRSTCVTLRKSLSSWVLLFLTTKWDVNWVSEMHHTPKMCDSESYDAQLTRAYTGHGDSITDSELAVFLFFGFLFFICLVFCLFIIVLVVFLISYAVPDSF